VTTKNLESFFNTIQSAQAPEKFTYSFLTNLEFSSSNDRLFVKLLKELKFLDDSGVPTQKYYEFLDGSEAKVVLAKSIKEAYEDLFVIRKDAYRMTKEEVYNKLKTLTQGKKSDNVLNLMAGTFVALCEYADWEGLEKKPKPDVGQEKEKIKDDDNPKVFEKVKAGGDSVSLKFPSLHYNIQIHLPDSRDPAVYDAIFESLKKHLT
jgi:hypothetical protein